MESLYLPISSLTLFSSQSVDDFLADGDFHGSAQEPAV